jgi:hypothetical protein
LKNPAIALPNPFGGVNWLVVGFVVAATISAMLPVLQNATTTSRGFEVQALQAKQVRLEGEIELIEADVARLSSLARIQKRAAEIGLAPASSPIYIDVDVAGPAPAKIPAEFLPPPAAQIEPTEGWLSSLLRWLPSPLR